MKREYIFHPTLAKINTTRASINESYMEGFINWTDDGIDYLLKDAKIPFASGMKFAKGFRIIIEELD